MALVGSATAPRRAVVGIRMVAPADVQLAFTQAAVAGGIVLGSQSFNWLCEAGSCSLSAGPSFWPRRSRGLNSRWCEFCSSSERPRGNVVQRGHDVTRGREIPGEAIEHDQDARREEPLDAGHPEAVQQAGRTRCAGARRDSHSAVRA